LLDQGNSGDGCMIPAPLLHLSRSIWQRSYRTAATMVVQLPVTVECVCGAVHLQGDAQPLSNVYCHCNACQKGSGTSFQHNARFSTDKA
jgi:hypothetical protein